MESVFVILNVLNLESNKSLTFQTSLKDHMKHTIGSKRMNFRITIH